MLSCVITYRVRRSRGEMCIGHSRLCVCLSVPHSVPTLLHRPECNLGYGSRCPLVGHYWADLQSVHGIRSYDNIHVCKLIALDTANVYNKWGDGGGGHCLVWMEWHPAGWSVCLPLLIFPYTMKSRRSLLAPAHLGYHGKKGSKTVVVWCGGCKCV